MDKQKYMPRLIDKKVETYLKTFGALCIEGRRGVGRRGHPPTTAKVRFCSETRKAISRTGGLLRCRLRLSFLESIRA